MSNSSDFTSSSCDRTRGRIPAGYYSDLPPGIIGTYERVHEERSGRSDYSVDVPVNPLSNLFGHTAGAGAVRVHLRRRNKVMTMTVEPFSGNFGASGLQNVYMHFSFQGLPHAPVSQLIAVKYNGKHHIGKVVVNPDDRNNKISIAHSYLMDIPSELGAHFEVDGFTMEWVINDSSNRC